jgi:predicted permease
VPFLTPPTLDLRVALFAALLTICAAALVAAWPLAQLRRSGPAPRGVAGESRPRVFRVLLVTQVSVTVALAVSAALLVRSLLNVRSNDPGYLVDGIVTAEIGLPRTLDTPQKIAAVEDGVRGHLEGRPGIRGIAVAYDRPLEANWSDVFRLASDVDAGEDVRGQAELRIVSPSYFDAMGVQVLAGRPFTVDDGLERPGIALVNESFARAHGGALIGRRLHSSAPRFTWGSSAPDEFEIAGIVEDERFRGLEHPSAPAVYLSTRQFPQTGFTLLIRTASGAGVGGREVRAAVRAVEPAAAVGTLTTLGRLLDDQLVARRVTADVVGGLSGLSLGLAALGVYGVLAMLVSSRAREIGVRLALGATPAGVAWRVVRESLVSVTPGIVGGLVLAFVAGRLLEAFLVGVSGRDPATFALVVLVVVIAAIAASTVPAVRAATVDPVSALRRD